METLIEKTTDAVNTESMSIQSFDYNYSGLSNKPVPVTFYVLGDIGIAETITFEFYDGDAWRDVLIDGDQQQLDNNNTVLYLTSPLEFRLSKDATANPVGVGISHTINIS